MSWETINEKIEHSQCACGNGYVTRQSSTQMDDWNRIRIQNYNEIIQCENCSSKFHIQNYQEYIFRPPWKGDSIRITSYLVPNGMTLLYDVTKKHFDFTFEEKIISSFSKENIIMIIDDMTSNKYSTRVELNNSKVIIDLYFKLHNKRSLPPIIEVLHQCLKDYDSYEWTFSVMKEFIYKEQERIKHNSEKINDSLSQSFKLNFK